jgi:hypothetical protein
MARDSRVGIEVGCLLAAALSDFTLDIFGIVSLTGAIAGLLRQMSDYNCGG